MKTTIKLFTALLLMVFMSSCKKDETSKNNLDVVVSVPSSGFHCNNNFTVHIFSSVSTQKVQYGTISTNGGTFKTNLNPGSYYIVAIAGSNSPDYTSMINSESKDCKECGYPITITSTTEKQTVTISRWCEFGVLSSKDHCN